MLTNVYTRLTFFKYGIPYIMEYNGNIKDAIAVLKQHYAAKPTCIFEGKRGGYLPAGYHSSMPCESIPNNFCLN